MKNPVINISETNLSGRDLEIAKKLLGRGGRLRSTKPKNDGEAAYLWRMVAFQVSTNPQHWCMPVTAEYDLPEEYWDRNDIHGAAKRRQERIKELKEIEDAIMKTIPKNEWHGINRWGKAFGAF